MSNLLRKRRLTGLASSLVMASVLALATASAASAFSEGYGGDEICGSNCYVTSGGAHTFYFNEGSPPGANHISPASCLTPSTQTKSRTGTGTATCSTTAANM